MSDIVETEQDIVVASFDRSHWQVWTAVGDGVFEAGPVADKGILDRLGAAPGECIASSLGKADGQSGHLASDPFRVSQRYLNFRIAGADFEGVTCLDVVVNGQVVRSETGRATTKLHAATIDLAPWVGQQARLKVVDHSRDGRGHLSISSVSLSPNPAVRTDPPSLYREALRPRLHFTARQWAMQRFDPTKRQEGWLNDINGLVYVDGEYHLFAQRWSTCWLHAVSTDLVHWTEMPPAFYEETLGSGVQSGSCVVDVENTSGLGIAGGPPAMVAFWSRNDNLSQCISYSLNLGRTWTHYSGNPIFQLPERDPIVIRDDERDQWVMVLYGSGRYNILTSSDLLHWEQTGCSIPDSYECPDFFQLPIEGESESKWVLVQGDGRYSVGSFDGRTFSEETPRLQVDSGPNFYATQSWSVDDGQPRRIQVAWMRGGSYPQMPFNQQVSLPCELSLRRTAEGLRLFRSPVPELTSLIRDRKTWSERVIDEGQTWRIGSAWPLLRVSCDVELDDDSDLLITLCDVEVHVRPGDISVLAARQPTISRLTTVDVIVDLTSVEIFANGGEASLSACVFAGQPELRLDAVRGTCVIRRLRVDELDSIWDETASRP